MAVDARHLFLAPPQLFSNNNTMEPTNGGFNQTGYAVVSPFSVAEGTSPLLHMYGSSASTADTIIPTTADSFPYYTTDSANVDCDFLPLQTRKRSRDNYYHHHLLQHHSPKSSSCITTTTTTTPFSFLGQDIDISSHINQQQHDINRFVSLHMERVKFEMEEKRKKQARTIMEAIENGLAKRLRVKEEERERIRKINHALEERVKSLSVENQIWRDLAQTNEATANNLRTNLEQVLAQVKDLRNVPGAGLANVNAGCDNDGDDAQSCCGSSSGEETVGRTVATERRRKCRNCGEEESCVLLLPCRHLCLCGVCGTSVHTCPICRSPKNASVHVNMSS